MSVCAWVRMVGDQKGDINLFPGVGLKPIMNIW